MSDMRTFMERMVTIEDEKLECLKEIRDKGKKNKYWFVNLYEVQRIYKYNLLYLYIFYYIPIFFKILMTKNSYRFEEHRPKVKEMAKYKQVDQKMEEMCWNCISSIYLTFQK